MDSLLINNILSLVLIVAVIIVGFILKHQINSQKEKIESVTQIFTSMSEYVKIFDMELPKKYIAGQKLIMEQDLEILKRKTVSETTKKTASTFSKEMERRMEDSTNRMINDLTKFTYWFFKNHVDVENRSEFIKEMLPNIAEELLKYFEFLDSEVPQYKKPNS